MDIPPPDSSGPATLSYSPAMMRPLRRYGESSIPRPIGPSVSSQATLLHRGSQAGGMADRSAAGRWLLDRLSSSSISPCRCRCCAVCLSFHGCVEPGLQHYSPVKLNKHSDFLTCYMLYNSTNTCSSLKTAEIVSWVVRLTTPAIIPACLLVLKGYFGHGLIGKPFVATYQVLDLTDKGMR